MSTVQDIIVEGITIAVMLKVLYSIEELLMMRNWLSVKVENCLGPIHVNIKDADGDDVKLAFNTLADYKTWIKNHISAANKIPALMEDETSEDEQ